MTFALDMDTLNDPEKERAIEKMVEAGHDLALLAAIPQSTKRSERTKFISLLSQARMRSYSKFGKVMRQVYNGQKAPLMKTVNKWIEGQGMNHSVRTLKLNLDKEYQGLDKFHKSYPKFQGQVLAQVKLRSRRDTRKLRRLAKQYGGEAKVERKMGGEVKAEKFTPRVVEFNPQFQDNNQSKDHSSRSSRGSRKSRRNSSTQLKQLQPAGTPFTPLPFNFWPLLL